MLSLIMVVNEDQLKKRYAGLPDLPVWIDCALFGYRYVELYLQKLSAGARVLEIGSGSGILLSIINSHYPDLYVEGVEPFGSGFKNLNVYYDKLKEQGAVVHKCGYEQFAGEEKYDLIFLVNVFEHLPDWKHFVGFIRERLTKDGVCVILLPNYVFPYEPHFGIPIVVNKSLTYRLFKRGIERHEKEKKCEGLWKSLNFVKYPSVCKHVKQVGLRASINTRIISDMIDRVDESEEFAKRQRWIIVAMGKLAKRLGLLYLLRFKVIQNVLPYMLLEIKH